MDFIRSFDVGAFDADRFDSQVLADLENCFFIICRSPAGSGGPATHVHDCDQMYYVLDGVITLLVGDVEHTAGPRSLVFIPRGTPHRYRNDGPIPEIHLDILLPPPPRGRPVFRLPVPGQDAPREPVIYHAGQIDQVTESDEPSVTSLSSPQTGTPGIEVNVVQAATTGPPTSWHIHDFAQLFWVLEGTLAIEIAGERYDVTPGHLVVLHAGIPHRNWNEAGPAERHLAFLIPAPTRLPISRPVAFGLGAAAISDRRRARYRHPRAVRAP